MFVCYTRYSINLFQFPMPIILFSPLSRVICPTKFKIGGHSNPFGGSSITYVGSVCHQSRVIWSWGAHSALTSWSRWFYTVKWSKLAIFSGLSGRFLGVVWWFQSFLQVRTCLYLDDQVKFWKKFQPGWRRTPESGPHFYIMEFLKLFSLCS